MFISKEKYFRNALKAQGGRNRGNMSWARKQSLGRTDMKRGTSWEREHEKRNRLKRARSIGGRG